MIRILTDTGSDITYREAEASGLDLVELGVTFDEFPYDYHNDLDFSVFYGNLTKAKNLPRTSQINPSQYLEVFNDAKQKGDEVVVITLSGGLSGTHASAKIAQEECGYDAITIIDSSLATIAQRMLVDEALKLREQNKTRAEMEKTLLNLRERIGFCCCLDTMTYLKKGGRVPPALSLIGNVLNIKPVVSLKDGKAKPIAKVRGFQAGIRTMQGLLEKEGCDKNSPVYFGYTENIERGKAFMEDTAEKYGIKDCRLFPVGCVIGTHAGPNAAGVAYVRK